MATGTLTTTQLRASTYHRGKRVSRAHAIMLAEYERQHGAIWINQGRRTISEQWGFWNTYQRYGRPVAAYPSQSAPHIKWGQANHAIDANSPHPVNSLAQFYRSHGVRVVFNVRSEAWHMDTLNEYELLAAARRIHKKRSGPRVLRKGMKGEDVQRMKVKLRFLGFVKQPKATKFFGKGMKRGVKKFQKAHNLGTDGVIGPKTRRAINRAYKRRTK